MAEWSSIVCWYHISFIHSSIDGHLSCLHSVHGLWQQLKSWVFGYLFIYLAASVLQCHTWDLHCGMQDLLLPYVCFSCCGLHACRLSGLHACRPSSLTVCGVLVLPPGMEPASPALEGRFLTPGPPGKSQRSLKQESEMVSFAISCPWECGKDGFEGGKTREEETSNRRSSWWWLPR